MSSLFQSFPTYKVPHQTITKIASIIIEPLLFILNGSCFKITFCFGVEEPWRWWWDMVIVRDVNVVILLLFRWQRGTTRRWWIRLCFDCLSFDLRSSKVTTVTVSKNWRKRVVEKIWEFEERMNIFIRCLGKIVKRKLQLLRLLYATSNRNILLKEFWLLIKFHSRRFEFSYLFYFFLLTLTR